MLKDFLRTAQLTPDDLHVLLDISARYTEQPLADSELLPGRMVVLYFGKPSTRTRLSFESAVLQLGGLPAVVGPQELQLGRGETIEDTARVISAYASAFVIRTFSDQDVARSAAAASIPVINALTDGHHPCQSIADVFTIRQHFGRTDGIRLAYIGDGNNVAHSLMEAAALAGMDMRVATPPGYEPDKEVVRQAQLIGERTGGSVTVGNDPLAAAGDADVVYTDVWVSMGTPEEERTERVRHLSPYQVNEKLMDVTAPDSIFMHCLPAHRGEEVTAAVIDGPRSVVFEQAANRGPTEQALLYGLLEGKLQGA
ncbi:MAG: ornithine carbamoyltransferase [Chloroflexota bacterium]